MRWVLSCWSFRRSPESSTTRPAPSCWCASGTSTSGARPGGSLEPDESPADGVVREVWEETGLLVEPLRVLGVYGGADYVVTYPNGHQAGYITTVFECVAGGGALTKTSAEVSDAAFVSAAELPRYALTPWAQQVLPRLYRPSADTHFDAPTWRPDATAV